MKMGGRDHHMYIYLLGSLKLCLAFGTALLSPKHPTCILQGNLKSGVCNWLNLLLGGKVGPCLGTTGPHLGCPLYHAVTYMRACNQVLCTMLKLAFLF